MTDWKEVPYLFSNGKFKIRYRGRVCSVAWFNPIGSHFQIFNKFWEDGKRASVFDDTTKLIARKIEDMTDEEFKFLDWDRSLKNHYCEYPNNLACRAFLYLLSIGVYPFDQSHFGETVIDVKEIE